MAFAAMAVLLFLPFHCCNAYKKPSCDAKVIARRLGYNPDAWKLAAEEHPRYRLMFHSKGNLETKYRCLCTTTSSHYPSDKWKRTIKYHTSPNDTTTLHGTQTVSSNKSDDWYIYDNILETPYYTIIHTPKSFYFNRTISENEVIYANKHRCLLMKSKELGYHVWVYTAYYQQKGVIPYDCVFFYEACTDDAKIWVYKDCPRSEYCLGND